MSINISVLQKQIGIIFTSKKILLKSLTHKSSNAKDNNEKLEFLGDRVLGLIISKKLLELFPNDKEGVLDKKLASLVNKKMCFLVCESFELSKYIKTNSSNKNNYKIEDKIISDACEAIIGAIFLDQGIKVAERYILDLWSEHINNTTKTINWMLSVNIEALNPPYKVYKRELIITIDAVIHRSAPDI